MTRSIHQGRRPTLTAPQYRPTFEVDGPYSRSSVPAFQKVLYVLAVIALALVWVTR